MNIFVLDRDPKLAAQYHCDKHVVKMILESTQLMSNAIRGITSIKGEKLPNVKYPLYQHTHTKHPCSLWARESKQNFKWLTKLAKELCKEYMFRYQREKEHACTKRIYEWGEYSYLFEDQEDKEIEFCQSVDQSSLSIDRDPVKAYRSYYKTMKFHLLTYTRRELPYWINDMRGEIIGGGNFFVYTKTTENKKTMMLYRLQKNW